MQSQLKGTSPKELLQLERPRIAIDILMILVEPQNNQT
jgi:hypothetical protein